MFRPGDRVLVALSGGGDSTGLALVLSELRRRLAIELVAGHVHHGLRGGEADLDQECAAAVAATLDIPFHAAALTPGSLGRSNIEARARAARYAALAKLAQATGCAKIATGHTLDDQAETFLLRLLRGSAAAGLAAIHPHRADGVVRPLIDCRRAAVAAVVRAAGLRHRVDSSNADPRFQRTLVRSRLLPLLAEINPAAIASCARAADQARGDAVLAGRWVADAAAALGIGRELPVGALAAVPADARGSLARYWLVTRLGTASGLGAAHIAAVAGLASGDVGGREVHLPGGRVVRRQGGLLVLVEELAGAQRRRSGRSAAAAPPVVAGDDGLKGPAADGHARRMPGRAGVEK